MCEEAPNGKQKHDKPKNQRWDTLQRGAFQKSLSTLLMRIQAAIDANLFPAIARAMVEGEAKDQKEAARIVASADAWRNQRAKSSTSLTWLVCWTRLLWHLWLAMSVSTLDALDAVTNILQAGECDKKREKPRSQSLCRDVGRERWS